MGLLMRNGIEYSSGGGSESGDVSVYGAFIDTDNVIVPTTVVSGNSTMTYTATEDCYIAYEWANHYQTLNTYYINDKFLFATWADSSYTLGGFGVFLKKGQVFKAVTGDGYTDNNKYTVYGIQQGSNTLIHYDNTEQVIGTWFGDTLYQKTLILNNQNLDVSGTAIDITSLGVDMCCPVYSGCYYIVSGVKRGFQRIEYQEPNDLYLYPAVSRTGTTCYVTIQYTKTT